MRIVAVSELTRYLKAILEEDGILQDVWVRGEVSNFTQSSAGHRYFSLKDETASIRCVLFRGNGFYAPPLRNGVSVMVHGRMSVYEQRGDVQFYCDEVLEAGIGELHLRFEALKARLEAEGLFAEERKRPLPTFPSTVGVVTSPQAAALRDIVRTLQLRFPLVRVVLAPTLVQGDGAGEQIAAALDGLNVYGEADVIIVARGGGSLEELWAFNEESVARAIARSRVPVVSGVGHETDFTIADFVADARASTPTAAAAMAVPDAREWRDTLVGLTGALVRAMEDVLTQNIHDFEHIEYRLKRSHPEQLIPERQQHVDELYQRLTIGITNALEHKSETLRSAARHLHSLSPLLTLGRGYAVVRTAPQGTLITSVKQVAPGQGLTIHLTDGALSAVAGSRLPEAVPDAGDEHIPPHSATPPGKTAAVGQGSLRTRPAHLNGNEDSDGKRA